MKPILCPIDFSDVSNNALRYASKLAQDMNCPILVVHVLHVPAVDMYSPANVLTSMMDAQKESALFRIEAILKEFSAEFSCSYSKQVEFGFAADVIAEIARKNELRMICMGTHGENKGLNRFLGSVSYETVKRADCAVMVVPDALEYQPIKVVVLGHESGLDLDYEISEIHHCLDPLHLDLSVLTIVPDPHSDYEFKLVNDKGGTKEIQIQHHSIEDAIYRYVIATEAEMLVLKRQHRGFIENLLHKSTIKQVMGNANIPVLIIN